MAAPREILALLESVVDVFLADVKHRERAAFILCDELVEMACKMRAREHNHHFDMRSNFHEAWNADGVKLDPADLGKRVQESRDTRNNLQHGSAAATVDAEHCASAIIDSTEVVDSCWPGCLDSQLRPAVGCGLRVVRLYSAHGDPNLRQPFEDRMRDADWDFRRAEPTPNEIAVRLGLRGNWRQAVAAYSETVEEILNELEVPDGSEGQAA